MSEDLIRKLSSDVARRIAAAIADNDAIWEFLDEEVQERLRNTSHDDAQLWLSADGQHRVCMDLFGGKEPFLVPFFVPKPSMPVKATFQAQVDESRQEIAALRAFAAQLTDMADAADAQLAAILAGQNRTRPERE
jgi:hypothetical protein